MYAVFYCPSSIIDQERPVNRMMEVTDDQRLGVVVCNALIGYVNMVQILHSTRLGYTPVW